MCSAGNYWWQLQCSCKWLWQWDLWIQQLLYFLMRRGGCSDVSACVGILSWLQILKTKFSNAQLLSRWRESREECGRVQRIKHQRLANLQLWTSDWTDCWQGEQRGLLLCSSHLYWQCVGRRDFFSPVEDRAKACRQA